MQQFIVPTLCLLFLLLSACAKIDSRRNKAGQPVYQDVPYLQDYAVKYFIDDDTIELKKVCADRNGVIQVLAANGLCRPHNGHFQYPGTLRPDRTYLPMQDKRIRDMVLYEQQFVYLDDNAVLSNAWAGKLFSQHALPGANLVCGGMDFAFMISDGKTLICLKDSRQLWSSDLNGEQVLSIKYRKSADDFLILTGKALYSFAVGDSAPKPIYQGQSLTCFEIAAYESTLIIGTTDGYLETDAVGSPKGGLHQKLPWTELTAIREIIGQVWFGSTRGAFMLRDDGKFNYYYGERWLPGSKVVDIASGPENSVLILTDTGLGQICFKMITLEEKAMVYENQVRQRHIRYGINSDVTRLKNHDLSTSENRVADSDNLWTGMYLGSQLFRYLVTGSEDAKQNCYEAFEAMERLHRINGIKGLFGRSFERRGYQEFKKEY